MAEGAKAVVSGFMSPGIGIVKSWQGIAEIVFRGVIIILGFFMAAAGGSCQSAVGEIPQGNLVVQSQTDAAAGWLIFMGILLIIYEVLMIVQRFVNIKIINQHIFIVIIIDVVVSFVMAFLVFCAAVSLAVYNPQWQDIRNNNTSPLFNGTLERIIGATGATAAFGFFTMSALIGKGVFMIVGGLVLNWGPTRAKYNVSSGSTGPE